MVGQNKLREEMAKQFLAALDQGEMPWQACWQQSRPVNASTGKLYHGVNALYLSYWAEELGYTDPRWCTYKQARDNGWQVRKGSKACRVEYWAYYDTKQKKLLSWKEAKDCLKADPNYMENLRLSCRTYSVFNAAQIDGIPAVKERNTDIGAIREQRDTLILNMGIGYRETGTEAYYNSYDDTVTLPPEASFDDAYGYMATFLHECGHASGAEHRLNRDLSGGFGSPNYVKEELRAEIASAFTAQAIGMQLTDEQLQAQMRRHIAYVQNWAAILKNAPEELFRAIKAAEEISDYLIKNGDFQSIIDRQEITRDAALNSPAEQQKQAAQRETGTTDGIHSSLDPAVQPVVTILWSESELQRGEQMSLARADALFKMLDEGKRWEREQPGYTGSWYDKTKFRIDFTFQGKVEQYEGRQDFGDGDGSLIDHIRIEHEYHENDNFISYMELHRSLSEMERTTGNALRSRDNLTPTEVAYYTAIQAYVSECRRLINQGEYNLPPVPQLADYDTVPQSYRENSKEEIAQETAVQENIELDPDTPEKLAADLFDLIREHDPAFMRGYEAQRDKQIAATVENLTYSPNDTAAIQMLLLNIAQEGKTEEIRQRASALSERIDAFEERNNSYSIYQLKDGEQTRDYRSEPLEQLQAAGLSVQRENYELVYTAPLAPTDTLEGIYHRFNFDLPADFERHSLSISDIVVLRHGDRETAHYCDRHGFTEVPEFMRENPLRTAELPNETMIDSIINNTPPEPQSEAPSIQSIALTDQYPWASREQLAQIAAGKQAGLTPAQMDILAQPERTAEDMRTLRMAAEAQHLQRETVLEV